MLRDASIINYNTIRKEILSNKKDILVIFDFDYTITTLDSETSIGVFTKYLPIKYQRKKKVLDILTNRAKSRFAYRMIWKYKLKLLSKYYNKELLNKIDFSKEFIINDLIKDLILELNNNNIPIVIYSSGIDDVIKRVLIKKNIYSNNIKIISNSINIYTKKISQKVITPKKEKLKNINLNKIYVFGDKLDDLKITNNSINILVTSSELKKVIGD